MDPQDPACRLPLAWSPDSRWIALHQSAGQSTSRRMGSFDRGGQKLRTDRRDERCASLPPSTRPGSTCTSRQALGVGLAADCMSMSHFDRPVRRSVHALLLNKAVPTPLASHGDEGNIPSNSRKQERVRVAIELDRIGNRIVRLPGSHLATTRASSPAQPRSPLFLHRGAYRTTVLPAGRTSASVSISLRRRKPSAFWKTSSTSTCPSAARKMLYAKLQGQHEEEMVSRRATPEPDRRGGSQLKVRFDEGLRRPARGVEAFVCARMACPTRLLYDPGLHGLDLEGTKNKYRPFLETITSRNDLYYFFGEQCSRI